MTNFQGQLGESPELLMDKMGRWVDTLVLNVPNILIAAVVAAIAFFLSEYVKKLTVKTTRKFTSNKTILNLIANLTSVISRL